jgi:hypothetical protein
MKNLTWLIVVLCLGIFTLGCGGTETKNGGTGPAKPKGPTIDKGKPTTPPYGDDKTGDDKTGDDKTGDDKTGDDKTGDEDPGVDLNTPDDNGGDAGADKTGDDDSDKTGNTDDPFGESDE